MVSSPDLQQLGLTPEQMQVIADLSVKNVLCQLKAKSLAVPAPAPEPAAKQAEDLQTVNMQAEAETKRKAEGDMTDEDSDDEELRDADVLNNGDSTKPPEGKARVSREEKREKKAKALNGKGATKGTTSVQKTA